MTMVRVRPESLACLRRAVVAKYGKLHGALQKEASDALERKALDLTEGME